MNTLAATIRNSLDTQGIQRLRFRILKLAGGLRHTTPVADTDGRHGRRVPAVSISELFNADALAPRTGEYVLNVDDGRLAFLPATARKLPKSIETRATALKLIRARQKTGRRQARHLHAGHRLAA